MGLADSMLYSWRSKRQPFEEQKRQQAELSRLKRENARLEEEVAFLKKGGSVLCKNAQIKDASRHRVAKIMKVNGLRANSSKKYKATTNSKHSLPVAANLFERYYCAFRSGQPVLFCRLSETF